MSFTCRAKSVNKFVLFGVKVQWPRWGLRSCSTASHPAVGTKPEKYRRRPKSAQQGNEWSKELKWYFSWKREWNWSRRSFRGDEWTDEQWQGSETKTRLGGASYWVAQHPVIAELGSAWRTRHRMVNRDDGVTHKSGSRVEIIPPRPLGIGGSEKISTTLEDKREPLTTEVVAPWDSFLACPMSLLTQLWCGINMDFFLKRISS